MAPIDPVARGIAASAAMWRSYGLPFFGGQPHQQTPATVHQDRRHHIDVFVRGWAIDFKYQPGYVYDTFTWSEAEYLHMESVAAGQPCPDCGRIAGPDWMVHGYVRGGTLIHQAAVATHLLLPPMRTAPWIPNRVNGRNQRFKAVAYAQLQPYVAIDRRLRR